MAEVLPSAEALRDALTRGLQLRPTRALVAIVEVPPGAGEQADQALADALDAAGVAVDAVERCDIAESAACRARLATLNRERDLLLRERRAVVLVAPDAASVRLLREVAPDLTAAPDLWVSLARDVSDADWTTAAAAIRERMAALHGSLDFTGLLPGSVEKRTVPLEELYIELLDLRGGPGDAPAAMTGGERPRPCLVLADPGAGKTTALRHLAATYAGRHGDPLGLGDVVPILLPLADLGAARAQDRVRSLVAYLPDWLAERGIPSAGALGDHLGDVLLLLDGVDELREPGARWAVVEEAATLAEDGRVAGVVVTGRSFLVDELRTLIPRFRLVALRPADPEQVERYLGAFVALRGASDPPRIARELARSIQADPDLRDLARTPLLLLFLALLHELEGRLPDRRVEIYNRLAELLVERWVRARSLSSVGFRRTATRGEAWRVLGPLAWWVVERGGGAVPEAAIERQLTELEARREDRPEAERRARDLLDLLQRDSALLRPEPGHRWAFVHPSVAEFFAGRDAERDPERWEALVADPFRAEWREIVLFAAGVVGVERGSTARLDELVEAVHRGARRPGRYEARHPSLLVGLLREDPLLSSRQKRTLVARLCEFWFKNAFYPASAHAVQSEAVAFLRWGATSPLRVTIMAELERWFGADATREVRWERLFHGAVLPVTSTKDVAAMRNLLKLIRPNLIDELGPAPAMARMKRYALGSLAESLPDLLPMYGLSAEAMLAELRARAAEDWRFALANGDLT